MKMCFEIPIVTKMCLCFPLRFGLLIGSFIRVALSVFVLWEVTVFAKRVFDREMYISPLTISYFVFIMTVALADFLYTWLFIKGLFSKTYYLMYWYYQYNVALLILSILGSIVYIGPKMRKAWRVHLDPQYSSVWYMMMVICIVFLFLICAIVYWLSMNKAVMKKYKGAHEDGDDQNETSSQHDRNSEIV